MTDELGKRWTSDPVASERLAMMPALFDSVLCLACLFSAGAGRCLPAGYLYHCTPAADGSVRLEAEPYRPQAGDLVIFTYRNVFWRILYTFVGSGPPYHAGIVVEEPNARLSNLEAAATTHYRVYLLPVHERFPAYEGRIWVRRLKVPLTPEETQRLMDFATDQTDKGFAFGRLFLGGTLFRPRGAVGAWLFGETCLDRDRWFCSELVVAACVAAGLLDGEEVPANGVYPRDLFLDQAFNFSVLWGPPLLWTPQPHGGATTEKLIEKEHLETEEREVLGGKEKGKDG
jgi:hypothetical protein